MTVDLVLWHFADDVLVGSKVRYLSNFSAAPHFGERPQSALCSRWLTTQRMGEDAPQRPLPAPPNNRAVGQLVIRFGVPEGKSEVSYLSQFRLLNATDIVWWKL